MYIQFGKDVNLAEGLAPGFGGNLNTRIQVKFTNQMEGDFDAVVNAVSIMRGSATVTHRRAFTAAHYTCLKKSSLAGVKNASR